MSAASGLSPTPKNPITLAGSFAGAILERWARPRALATAALALAGLATAAMIGGQLPIAGLVGDAARGALTDTSVLPLHVVLMVCAGALLFALARRSSSVVLKRTALPHLCNCRAR